MNFKNQLLVLFILTFYLQPIAKADDSDNFVQDEFVTLWSREVCKTGHGYVNDDGSYGGCGERYTCRNKVEKGLSTEMDEARDICGHQTRYFSSSVGQLNESISSNGKDWNYKKCGTVKCEKFINPIPTESRDVINPVGEHEHHYFGKVEIAAPTERAFPKTSDTYLTLKTTLATGSKSKSITTNDIPAGQTDSESIGVLKGKSVGLTFYYKDGDYSYTLNSMTPTSDGYLLRVNLKRIDVNDMLITRQDGSTYYARGRYSVYFLRNGEEVKVASGQTKSGVDVVPGYTYVVYVYAESEEGITQKQKFTMNF